MVGAYAGSDGLMLVRNEVVLCDYKTMSWEKGNS